MIRLSFTTLQSATPMAAGPAAFFRIEGNNLLEGPSRRLVATYGSHYWQIDGRHVSGYECRDRTQLNFENRDGESSEVYGPFSRLLFPNGCCYADDRRIADYVEYSDQWLRTADSSCWSAIVVSPAANF